MGRVLRRVVLLAVSLAAIPAFGSAKWTQPTPEELKMTSDPAAPGASAVYLFLEETGDDIKHQRTCYARIKILKDDGKQYGDIVMPYWQKEESIRGVEGRTIHSDGTVVLFTGKPWQREVAKGFGLRRMEKGFSMPDVQVGSIIEYRYMTTYDDWWPPHWYLQQPIFVHEAHYHFVPGGGGIVFSARFVPPNAQVDDKKGWDLRVSNVPAEVDEEDAPPRSAIGYHVLFFYMREEVASADEYWARQGAFWSQGVNDYVAPDQLKPIVAQLVAPGDSDEQKLRKIYIAVMSLENTDFTRERGEEEIKAEKQKINTVADVWTQKRGNRQQIALLFIGLARAAGLTAYAMRVTDRDENVFSKNQTDWDQLDDTLAIVKLNGIETYVDPGDRYCTFGQLHWKHTFTAGVRQTDKGTELAQTPYPSYTDTGAKRSADLTMDADGQLHGEIRVVMTGAEALSWRQEALLTDAEATRKDFVDSLTPALPSGVSLQITSLGPLDNGEVPLTATLSVSGAMGTRTGHRLFLPASFFEAQTKARFASDTRESPVYLHEAGTIEDDVKITLPPAAAIESLPQHGALTFSDRLNFDETYQGKQNVYQYSRREKVGQILFATRDYSNLRVFFQKVNAQDQIQLLLTIAPAPPTAAVQAR